MLTLLMNILSILALASLPGLGGDRLDFGYPANYVLAATQSGTVTILAPNQAPSVVSRTISTLGSFLENPPLKGDGRAQRKLSSEVIG